MAKTYDSDTLGIAEDLKFQRRTWKVQQGLESLDQIKHAVVEPSSGITIFPKEC